MMRAIKKHWFTAVTAILSLTLVGGLAYWLWWGSSRPPVQGPAPNISLINKDGQPVQLSDLLGKVKLVYLYHERPQEQAADPVDSLLKMQDQLKKKGLFGDDVVLIAAPFGRNTTPQDIGRYKERYRADLNGWFFAKETADNIAKDFRLKLMSHSGTHSANNSVVLLIDRYNSVRKVIGAQIEGYMDHGSGSTGDQQLMSDIQILVKE